MTRCLKHDRKRPRNDDEMIDEAIESVLAEARNDGVSFVEDEEIVADVEEALEGILSTTEVKVRERLVELERQGRVSRGPLNEWALAS
jgi:hypothetical protein